MYCGTLSVSDQDEVGFANSERCEHERRLTLNTDCIYRLQLCTERYLKQMNMERNTKKRDEEKTEPRG